MSQDAAAQWKGEQKREHTGAKTKGEGLNTQLMKDCCMNPE
jgi:hypothetical protein